MLRTKKNIDEEFYISKITLHKYTPPNMKLITNRTTLQEIWKEAMQRTSLMVQWIRICLLMQDTRVRSLLQEYHTCCRATKPMLRLFEPACSRAHDPQLLSLRAAMTEFSMHRACAPQARAPREAHALQWRAASAHPEQWTLVQPKISQYKSLKKKKKKERMQAEEKGHGLENWSYIKKGRTEKE